MDGFYPIALFVTDNHNIFITPYTNPNAESEVLPFFITLEDVARLVDAWLQDYNEP